MNPANLRTALTAALRPKPVDWRPLKFEDRMQRIKITDGMAVVAPLADKSGTVAGMTIVHGRAVVLLDIEGEPRRTIWPLSRFLQIWRDMS